MTDTGFECAGCGQRTTSSHYYEAATGQQVHEADDERRAQLQREADASRVTLFDQGALETGINASDEQVRDARSLLGVPEPPPLEDVPGVLRHVLFVGGSLDGTRRPIGLHGRAALEDGDTYERLVPNHEAWRYSVERDRFEQCDVVLPRTELPGGER